MLLKQFSPSQVHEAGHAVIAEQLGVRVKWVRAKGYGHDGSGHTEFEEHDLLAHAETMISLAGPVAEESQFGVCPDNVKKCDLDRIIVLAWAKSEAPGDGPLSDEEVRHASVRLCERRKHRKPLPPEVIVANQQLCQEAQKPTKDMVTRHWHEITEVAKALSDQDCLSGDEVRTIINKRDVG
jgi:hypothetical protein